MRYTWLHFIFSRTARLSIVHVTQYWTAMMHLFCSTSHMATELTTPKCGGLCHLVRDSETCVWDQSLWHRLAATVSTVCVMQLGAVADWWCSWPIANTLLCLCSCQKRTFWTYFVTINLFSLYLMNCMFHAVLDAAGDVLRVHYKSMKCDVSFSQRNVFRSGRHLSCMFKKFFLLR